MSEALHTTSQSEWVTASEAAAMIGRSRRSVRRYADRGRWRTRLDMLAGGQAPTRFYHREDVLQHLRAAPDSDMAGGADVDKDMPTRDGAGAAQPAPLPVRAVQQVELLLSSNARMVEVLEAHTEALRQNTSALEAQRRADRRHDRLAGRITIAVMALGLAGLLALMGYIVLTA